MTAEELIDAYLVNEETPVAILYHYYLRRVNEGRVTPPQSRGSCARTPAVRFPRSPGIRGSGD